MILSSVDLPQPDGPTMARNSPRAASSEMPSMATSGFPLPSSKTFLTFRSETRAAMLGTPLVHDAAADNGLERDDFLDLVFGDRQRVGRQDREIGELADFDRAGAMLGKSVAGGCAGIEPQRFLPADGLPRAIDRAVLVLARDRDRHVHEGVEQVDRIVGALGYHVEAHMVDHRPKGDRAVGGRLAEMARDGRGLVPKEGALGVHAHAKPF